MFTAQLIRILVNDWKIAMMLSSSWKAIKNVNQTTLLLRQDPIHLIRVLELEEAPAVLASAWPSLRLALLMFAHVAYIFKAICLHILAKDYMYEVLNVMNVIGWWSRCGFYLSAVRQPRDSASWQRGTHMKSFHERAWRALWKQHRWGLPILQRLID